MNEKLAAIIPTLTRLRDNKLLDLSALILTDRHVTSIGREPLRLLDGVRERNDGYRTRLALADMTPGL